MERMKASDFHPEVLKLFDKYVHGLIDRRGFLDGAAKFTGTVGAAATLDMLRPNYAAAQQVAPNDARLKVEYAEYQSPKGYGRVRGLLARPANAKGRLPGIFVIHENRGLNPHIEDVVRRAALAGYLAFGPDILTSKGGYPGTDEEGVKLQGTLEQPKMLEDFEAGARWLKAHAECNGRIGVVGFCFGGSITNQLAVRLGPDLGAAVPFYGGQARAEDVPKISAPLMLMYAETDERINAGWPPYEAALKANNKRYTMYSYPGTQHGFHNDSTPRYNAEAAKLAWDRTIKFFDQNLKSSS
jgi:carboxymethylenebutenolidase